MKLQRIRIYLRNPFLSSIVNKKVLQRKRSSSYVSVVRTFNGFVELKTRFLSIWTHSEVFSGLRNPFCGFCKSSIF